MGIFALDSRVLIQMHGQLYLTPKRFWVLEDFCAGVRGHECAFVHTARRICPGLGYPFIEAKAVTLRVFEIQGLI